MKTKYLEHLTNKINKYMVDNKSLTSHFSRLSFVAAE